MQEICRFFFFFSSPPHLELLQGVGKVKGAVIHSCFHLVHLARKLPGAARWYKQFIRNKKKAIVPEGGTKTEKKRIKWRLCIKSWRLCIKPWLFCITPWRYDSALDKTVGFCLCMKPWRLCIKPWRLESMIDMPTPPPCSSSQAKPLDYCYISSANTPTSCSPPVLRPSTLR